MHTFAAIPFEFHIPTRIIFGVGCSQHLAQVVATFGRRAMLVTMPGVPCADSLQEQLASAGLSVVRCDRVRSNPLARMIDEAAVVAREEGVELVVGVGGGSVIDTAKGVAVGATHAGSVWEYSIDCAGGPREVTSAALPVVAVPTTAGTGAEASGVAVIGNDSTAQKGPVRSPHIYPRVALVDPELTLSMPPRLTASTGFDAFSHAFERYLSTARHPLVDALAESAMSAVVANLETAVRNGQDLAARTALSWSATQAIMAVAARVGEAGLHILGLPLSARLGVAHGESLAALLPTLLADAVGPLPDRAEWLAGLFARVAERTSTPGETACARGARAWLRAIGLDVSLADYGVDERMCGLLAESVNLARFRNTFYGRMTREEAREFYLRALRNNP